MTAMPWYLHVHGWNDHLYATCPALKRQAKACDVRGCDHAIVQGSETLDPIADYNPRYPKDMCGWCRRVALARGR